MSLKQVFLHVWHARRESFRYFVIGFSAFLLDIGSLYLLKTFLHLRPVLAVVINQIIIINYVFFFNKRWSFKSGGQTRIQLARFLVLTAINYLIAVSWMGFWNEFLRYNYLVVRTVNVALSVGWNFLLYKHWVYKQ